MAELVDLVDSERLHGCEMLESDAEERVVRIIQQLAPGLRRSLAEFGGLHDCWKASAWWSRALEGKLIAVQICMEPDPDDQAPADGAHISDVERGGYETDGGAIRRHAWLAVGGGLWLFDPTAHQFDGCGRADVDRYWVQEKGERIRFTEWRARQVGSRP